MYFIISNFSERGWIQTCVYTNPVFKEYSSFDADKISEEISVQVSQQASSRFPSNDQVNPGLSDNRL